jgi:hypothetical protein
LSSSEGTTSGRSWSFSVSQYHFLQSGPEFSERSRSIRIPIDERFLVRIRVGELVLFRAEVHSLPFFGKVGLVESVDCRARRPSSQKLCLPGCSAQNRTSHLTPDLKRPPLFCSAGFLTSQLNPVTRVKNCQAIIKYNKAIAIFFIFCELPANSCL